MATGEDRRTVEITRNGRKSGNIWTVHTVSYWAGWGDNGQHCYLGASTLAWAVYEALDPGKHDDDALIESVTINGKAADYATLEKHISKACSGVLSYKRAKLLERVEHFKAV